MRWSLGAGWPTGWVIAPPNCLVVSNNASPSRERSSPNPTSSFADEPTGNLDSHAGSQVLRLLREAVDELGQTVVMVTHDPSAAAIADRVLFLADGKVREEMTDPSVAKILDSMKALGG
ncbi:MAG: transporter related [Acidimicrobiales bacterium]|nr:transporter related [Acidimicrobiales bacterium]